MKIIDKTPLQDDKGEIGIISRVQGTLKYGFDWYAEMEAQKNLMNQLNRALEKGFVLIRNLNLPGSKIYIPLILINIESSASLTPKLPCYLEFEKSCYARRAATRPVLPAEAQIPRGGANSESGMSTSQGGHSGMLLLHREEKGIDSFAVPAPQKGPGR